LRDASVSGCSKTVARWIEAGWLKGHRGWDVGTHRSWMVREEDLLDFLADPDHFHRWDPGRIPMRPCVGSRNGIVPACDSSASRKSPIGCVCSERRSRSGSIRGTYSPFAMAVGTGEYEKATWPDLNSLL
jgi:hypothetical protein